MQTRLSCNLDKVALVRNARDHFGPDVIAAARACLAAGAHGITLHPRADRRHALFEDIGGVMEMMRAESPAINHAEMNVEGDLRPDLIDFLDRMRPQQFTIVPVNAGEKTSERGWGAADDNTALAAVVARLRPHMRLSLFIAADVAAVELAARHGLAAVEFYTGPYALAEHAARLAKTGNDKTALAAAQAGLEQELERLGKAAARARQLGLLINAGHDLTLANLPLLIAHLHPDEVSIGHALISEAFIHGLPTATQKFLQAMGV